MDPVLVLVLGIDLGHLEVLVLVLGIDLGHLEVLVLVLGIDLGHLEVLVLVLTFYNLVLLTSDTNVVSALYKLDRTDTFHEG